MQKKKNYYVDALERAISKKGMDTDIIQYLCSDEIPKSIKDALSTENIFTNGYLCLSKMYACAANSTC